MENTGIGWTGTPIPDGMPCPYCVEHSGVMPKGELCEICVNGVAHWLPGHTFNCWIGCSKVNRGCKHCYAEADMDKRRGRVVWGIHGTRSVTSYQYWRKALSWNSEAEAMGVRRKVFCASLADYLEDWKGAMIDSHSNILYWPPEGQEHLAEDVDGIPTFSLQTEQKEGWRPLTMAIIRGYVFKLIEKTPYLDWLLLTKRPENLPKMLPDRWHAMAGGRAPRNIWFGCTITTEDELLTMWPVFESFGRSGYDPFKIFLSCEPLTKPLKSFELCLDNKEGARPADWVIVGFESGHDAEPGHPDWVRSLRDQCLETETPFFFKQWGEYYTSWADLTTGEPGFKMYTSYQQFVNKLWVKKGDYCIDIEGKHCQSGGDFMTAAYPVAIMNRVGKKAGGNVLDGKIYQQFPDSVSSIDKVFN